MDDLNVVIMVGRLVFDPEMKESKTENKKAKIRIAVSRGKDTKGACKGAYFFNCQAYGKTAEAIGKYATKGRRVNIEGKLCEWKYDKDGETRTYVVIDIARFRLLDSPKQNGELAGPETKTNGSVSEAMVSKNRSQVTDIPF